MSRFILEPLEGRRFGKLIVLKRDGRNRPDHEDHRTNHLTQRPMKLVPICRPCVLELSCSFTVANRYEVLTCSKCGKRGPIGTFVKAEELLPRPATKAKALVQLDLEM